MSDVIVIKDRKDFHKLFSAMEKGVSETNTLLQLEVDSLAPLDILIITQFLIVQCKKGCTITIQSNDNIKEYVKAIKLVDFVKTNAYKPTTIRAIPNFTAMPIRRVERDKMVEYIHATERYFKSIIAGSKDLAMLNQCMSELINNVYDHSKSEIGAYVFCQYYPGDNVIKIAVSDYGIGIPNTVSEFRQNSQQSKLSEVDCIRWALEERNTIQSLPQNAGRGLDTVNSFVKQNKGSWLLHSGNAFLKGELGNNKFEENFIKGFQGTVIQITIQIDNLEAVDILESLDWDL